MHSIINYTLLYFDNLHQKLAYYDIMPKKDVSPNQLTIYFNKKYMLIVFNLYNFFKHRSTTKCELLA